MLEIFPRDAPPPRYAVLAESLFSRILSGTYPVGGRLPSEKELAQEFDVAIMTVRQGVGLLVKKGVVERRQGKGTFVKEIAATIGLIFGPNVADETAHYYRALLREIESGAHENRWACRYYDRMNPIVSQAGGSERQRELLRSDHLNRSFSGFIEVSPPTGNFVANQLFPGAPYASLADSTPNCDVAIDLQHFGRESVQALVSRGCRKLFYFRTFWPWKDTSSIVDGVLSSARNCGISAPTIHTEHLTSQGYASEKALFCAFRKLLRHWCTPAGAADMPDGIIFNDDIVLRAVAPAIMEARIAVPETLKIASQGNEGLRFHYGFPVIRYEISPKWLASQLLDVLSQRICNAAIRIEPRVHRGTFFFEE